MLQPARAAPGRPHINNVHTFRERLVGEAVPLPFHDRGQGEIRHRLVEERRGNGGGIAGTEAEIEECRQRQKNGEREEWRQPAGMYALSPGPSSHQFGDSLGR